MRVVLIDDERPALKIMGILLGRYPQIEIVGQFLSPLKALEDIPTLRPDLIFLDVDMPDMNGMEAASKILEIDVNTRIVFVTAYERYALQAYQFHPMDYILKPVDEERLDKLMEYLQRPSLKAAGKAGQKLMIRCFGDFCVRWENQEPIKWRTEKTKEIVAYLVDNYDRKISKEEILDNLWPEYDPEMAMKQLYNGIYYIRKTLSEYGAGKHMVIDKSYNLKLSDVDLDTAHLKKPDGEGVSGFEKLDAIMQGLYFEKEDYLWAREKREEYFYLYQKYLLKMAADYLENRQLEKAEMLYLKVLKRDPFNEAVAEKLIRLYLSNKDKIKGVRFYQAYEKTIKAELNEKPSAVLSDCYSKLKRL